MKLHTSASCRLPFAFSCSVASVLRSIRQDRSIPDVTEDEVSDSTAANVREAVGAPVSTRNRNYMKYLDFDLLEFCQATRSGHCALLRVEVAGVAS